MSQQRFHQYLVAKYSQIFFVKIFDSQAFFSGVDNQVGGWYSYRLSKTALNMATKNLSIELGRGKSKVICVALHPGDLISNM